MNFDHYFETLRGRMGKATDHLDSNAWMPPAWARMPRFRFGGHLVSVLWILSAGFFTLVLGIAILRPLYQTPWFQGFLERYPGTPSYAEVHTGFPWWLGLLHFLNLLFIAFIIRSGIQILADHPRLYWQRDCTPDTDWFRFNHPMPTDRVWTSKDDSVTIPNWLGIPGTRHTIGLARWWHFSFDLLWVLTGVAFYVLLFSTDQWRRLVPTSSNVFPNALSVLIQYWSLHFPHEETWTRYNALQQLTYFFTVFIVAPAQIIAGLMQGPAIANKLGWLGKVFNRQVARSLHFFGLLWFLFFILVHTSLVFVTGAKENLGYMFAGMNTDSWLGVGLFCVALLIVIATWYLASPFTIKHARLVQNIGRVLVGPLKHGAEKWSPSAQYSDSEISPHFWPNGREPDSDEYKSLLESNFAGYELWVGGLVEHPKVFSYDDLKAMPKQEQITEHFCIQGWSGVARWGGVPMRHILDLVKPTSHARYAVFYAFSEGADGGIYYDAHNMANMAHKLTLLAYEMNGEPLPMLHGAPLRLRCENELGFKMVKWIRAIEFVNEYRDLGSGQGGYNEDFEFYGNRQSI